MVAIVARATGSQGSAATQQAGRTQVLQAVPSRNTPWDHVSILILYYFNYKSSFIWFINLLNINLNEMSLMFKSFICI